MSYDFGFSGYVILRGKFLGLNFAYETVFGDDMARVDLKIIFKVFRSLYYSGDPINVYIKVITYLSSKFFFFFFIRYS